MDTSCLPQFATFLALGDWTTFALDLEELSVGVVAGRSSVPFYARFADERGSFVSCCGGDNGEAKGEGVPSKLLFVDPHLREDKQEEEYEKR